VRSGRAVANYTPMLAQPGHATLTAPLQRVSRLYFASTLRSSSCGNART
jgi:hypothetical protein